MKLQKMISLKRMTQVMAEFLLTCDRCSVKIYDNDTALVFQTPDGEVGLCEKCVEEVRREFIDENRDPNIIESGD